jgi:hypothetical protein
MKAGLLRNSFLALILIFIQGCASVPEFTSDFDVVLGQDYKPEIFKIIDAHPQHVLFIPIQQGMEVEYQDILFQTLLRQIKGLNLVCDQPMKIYNEMPSMDELQGLADLHQCDAILFVRAYNHSIFTPLSITINVVLERVGDGAILWKGIGQYDSLDKTVANAARRYTQKVAQKQYEPDRSLAILRSNPEFLQFVAYNLSQNLDELAAYSTEVIPKQQDTDKNKDQQNEVKNSLNPKDSKSLKNSVKNTKGF